MPELPRTYPVPRAPKRSEELRPVYDLLAHLDMGQHEIRDDMQRGSYAVAYRVVAAYLRSKEQAK